MDAFRSQSRNLHARVLAILTLLFGIAANASADATFFFSTGDPDGKIATLSRTASPGKLETETADDFVTTAPATITSATFNGVLVGGTTPANVCDVERVSAGAARTIAARRSGGLS